MQAARAAAQRGLGALDRAGKRDAVVGLDVGQALGEGRPGAVLRVRAAELLDGGPGLGAELVVGQAAARDADDPVAVGQQAGLGEVEEAGEQLAAGEVAGRPEEHDDVVLGGHERCRLSHLSVAPRGRRTPGAWARAAGRLWRCGCAGRRS
jgi:hypothetical protein